MSTERRARPASAWVALTLAATLLVAAAVVALSAVQDRALSAATAIVRELRQGRIDLYQGFLHVALARGEGSPWDRDRGRVLMQQGVAELRAALKKVDDPAGRRLQDQLAQFARALGRAGAADARRELELRLAFHELDLAAQQVDRQLRARLDALQRTLAAVFWGVLLLSGALLGLVSVGAVRSGRREAAATAGRRYSEERLRHVIDLVPHAIYAKDAEGRYLLANRTTAQYLGCEPHELVGRRPDDFGLDPQDARSDREIDREVLRTQRRRDGEVVRRFQGRDLAFAYSKIPFGFDGEGTDAVLGVSTDISELKRTEARLKQSVALLQATLQSTDNGVLVAARDGTLLLWNERLVALLGGAADPLRCDLAAVLAALGAPGTAEAAVVQQVGRRADGRFIESHAEPMRIDGAQAGWVWTFRDVTEREQAFADAHAREQELEARVQERTRSMAQAYAELQSFSDAVSHDLRAPLAAIDAFAQVLLYKHAASLEPQMRQHLERILASSANMRAMIHGLLELSRHARAPVHRRPLDLGAMAREAYELQAGAIGDRHVDFEVEEGLRASGDPVLVATLLQNLVGNALKYSRGRDPARIRVGRGSADGGPCFFVRDNGAGFDPACADRLFKPFSRLHDDREFQGHGIGLATASRIVARHGGRIWAEGAPGEGATFRFTLE